MNQQLALTFEPVRSRSRDPEASQRAGRNARQFAAGHFALILDARAQGPGTAEEIALRSGLDYGAVARRMGELQQAGKLALTGDERNGCREWRIA